MRREFAISVFVLIGLASAPGPAAGLMAPELLRARIEAFAGRPALVDPRLLLPDCAAPGLALAAGGRGVVASCAAPVWTVFVPLAPPLAAPFASTAAPAAARPAPPAIRRGERVTVEAEGEGFIVGIDAVAEADSRDGRVALRVDGGRRLVGIVGDDGRIRIRGLNAMVNGR